MSTSAGTSRPSRPSGTTFRPSAPSGTTFRPFHPSGTTFRSFHLFDPVGLSRPVGTARLDCRRPLTRWSRLLFRPLPLARASRLLLWRQRLTRPSRVLFRPLPLARSFHVLFRPLPPVLLLSHRPLSRRFSVGGWSPRRPLRFLAAVA